MISLYCGNKSVMPTKLASRIRTVILVPISIGIFLCGCSESKQDSSASISTHQSPASPIQQSGDNVEGSREYSDPRDVLPLGPITVDVMEFAMPQRLLELTGLLLKSTRENQAWFMEHVKNSKQGEPLEYDPRMGLSEAEYQEYISLTEEITTRKASTASLTISRKEKDVYTIDGDSALEDLDGIEIDLSNNLVRTPLGALTERSEIHTSRGAMGGWDGAKWKEVKLNEKNEIESLVSFSVGMLKPSGRGVIHYHFHRDHQRIDYILQYDLNPTN